MEVTLTIENTAGEQGSVNATGRDYVTALAAARALIPEDCKAMSILVDRGE
ncbi:hypothetical protein OHC50_16160 [Paenarthrobacter ilicis]|uniref:hypothetical protein n=1 Tax=Paenarthrobacter ilicis TaxID=43665 RepID=UPI00300B16F8